MSEESYQINVRRGVTGPQSATCELAAFDRFTVRGGIQPQTYEQYNDLYYDNLAATGGATDYVPRDIDERHRAIARDVYQQLGVISTRNTIDRRVKTFDEFQDTLDNLATGGFRTAVHLKGLHSVGVKRIEPGFYDVRSTSSPFPEGEAVAVENLFDHLDLTARMRVRASNSRRTYVEPNIIALPPEQR